MQRSTVLTAFQRAAALFLAASMVPAGWAQDASSVPSAPSAQMPAQQAVPSKSQPFDVKEYSQPRSPFPNLLAPYTARHVAPPNLANTPRIDQLMHDGKLYISMNDAVALALENNLDIAIARYNLNIADTDIWRAKVGRQYHSRCQQRRRAEHARRRRRRTRHTSGLGPGRNLRRRPVAPAPAQAAWSYQLWAAARSSPASIRFSRAPCNSITTSISAPPAFRPASSIEHDHRKFRLQPGIPVGHESVGRLQQYPRRPFRIAPFNPLSPQLNSNFQLKLTQHLLQGFGFAPNTRFIQIAKNNREISDVAFRLQITTTVDQIENMYWDLVFAYENVRVQKEQLAFAQKTLSDNQKQVQIGTLAPIEVVRAQSTVATNQQTLTLALTNLQLQQFLMKNALSRTLVDPALADAEVIPTSTMELPAQEAVIPTQDLVNDALGHRPELAEAAHQPFQYRHQQ